MKTSAHTLKTGLNLIQIKFDNQSRYATPAIIELVFDEVSTVKEAIRIGLEYIREVGNGMGVFQVKEDVENDSMTVQLSYDQTRKILDAYGNSTIHALFDDRHIVKEIICTDNTHANAVMRVALALCSFGLYGGYSYDYDTKRLTVF